MAKATIDQIDVRGRRVLMRVDFNVPLDERGAITDDRRIVQALPSIRCVIDRGGKLVLMSHLGRPKGKGVEPAFSLQPAAVRLRELLPGTTVHFPGDDCVGDAARQAVQSMRAGEIVLLENLRFHAAEQKGEATFAAQLAAYGEIFCNDAFGTAHRNDASMLAVPTAMGIRRKVAGLLLQKELRFLSEAIQSPTRPFLAVLGGAKVSDKLGAIANLLERVDAILVGGAMAYTFLKAKGNRIGSSLVQPDMLDNAVRIMTGAAAGRAELMLPQDHVCAQKIERSAPHQVATVDIAEGWMGLDIGPQTARVYASRLQSAGTVVWNGPMGVFETPPFDAGTRAVADGIAAATARGGVTVVGGGDTAAAVDALGMNDRFSHVSTGGGASLEMLEGKTFASVSILDEA
jgi:phosphoglycerate kinase